MAFTVNDFRDLITILEEQPQWREELRRLILTDELLALPQLVRDLTAAVRELAEAQQRFMAQTAERFNRIDKQFSQIDDRFDRVDERFDRVEREIAQLKDNVGRLNGRDLERIVRERPFVYLSRFARRIQAVDPAEIAAMLEEAVDHGTINEGEMEDAKLIDNVARGRRRTDGVPILLVTEISSVVDEYDLQRALRRGKVIERAAEQETLPIVLGETILEPIRQLAQEQKVGWGVIRSQN